MLAMFALLTACCIVPEIADTPATAQNPMKIILDTDIGDDIDDAYALALLASHPGVKLLGVTTAFGQTSERAELAAKLLQVMGRKDVPIYAGRRGEAAIREQYAWARGFRSPAIKKEDAVTFLKQQLDRAPGEITLIAVGPLTNVGDLLSRHPEVKSKIRRLVIMGGAIYVGYNNLPPAVPEWNIKCDPQAARTVFASGVPLLMAGLESTTMMKFEKERQKQLFGYGVPKTDALAALTNLWGGGTPTLFDTVAVAHALGEHYAETEQVRVEVEDSGLTRRGEGTPNATLLVRPQKEAFLDWFVATMAPRPR
jgi:purine nucleosidase